MFKLVLGKAEEPEIKLPTSIGSWKQQESSRKTSISALLTMPKTLTVWITTNWKTLQEMGISDHLTYEDLQDLLELTPKKDVLFFIGDWKAKVGSQEICGKRQIWPWNRE